MHAQKDLFIGATEGYHTFRIPSVVATVKGTVLAFCEGRKNDSHDSGDIALLLKRSEDGGASWSDLHIVWDDPGHTCGNPCPVVDQKSGAICLLMTHNLGTDVEPQIIDETSRGSRTVWLSRSVDDGLPLRTRRREPARENHLGALRSGMADGGKRPALGKVLTAKQTWTEHIL